MKTKSFLVMAISSPCFVLFYCTTAIAVTASSTATAVTASSTATAVTASSTATAVTASSTATAVTASSTATAVSASSTATAVTASSTTTAAASSRTATKAPNLLQTNATPDFKSEYSCCLASQKSYDKTINMWVVMSSKDAKDVLPVIYLAKQELLEEKQLPDGWDINIQFSNSNGVPVDAMIGAYELYINAYERRSSVFSNDVLVPDVGVFLTTNDYGVAKIAFMANRWRVAVLSPGGSANPMANPKYGTLYRLHGDDSQVRCLMLRSLIENDSRPWAGVKEVNKKFSPQLVITPGSSPDWLSNKVKAILKDENQEELRNIMRQILSEEFHNSVSTNEMNTVLPYAASVYDGVWYFVKAFKRAREDFNGSKDFFESVLEELNNKFESRLSNRTFSVVNRTLVGGFSLMKLSVDAEGSAKYEKQGFFEANGSIAKGSIASMNFVNVNVEAYTPPRDEPPCGFNNEHCMSTTKLLTIVFGSSVAFLSVVGVGVMLGANKCEYVKKLRKFVSIPSVMYDTNVWTWTGGDIEKLEVLQNRVRRVPFFEWTTVETISGDLGWRSKLKVLKHSNIIRFIGARIDTEESILVTEFCARRSLKNLLKDNFYGCGNCLQYPLIMDLISGLSFLHKSHIKIHGNLKSSNCLVDSRLVLKLSGFGLLALPGRRDTTETFPENSPLTPDHEKLWTAPEVLRLGPNVQPEHLTQEADIYSLAIIMNEIFSGNGDGPFPGVDELSSSDIIDRLINTEDPPFRPIVDSSAIENPLLIEIIKKCWEEIPKMRPSCSFIKRAMRRLFKDGKGSATVVESVMNRLTHYSENLESMAEMRTHAYFEEKQKWENLLHEILPPSVAEQLIWERGDSTDIYMPKIAQQYEDATIYFSDIVDFSEICAQTEPMKIVDMLNQLYSLFDTTISRFEVYKVETIGDAYVVASGLPRPNGTRHVEEICRMALALLKDAEKVEAPHQPGKSLQISIGINSGPCAAGVTGIDKPRYCLFGDTVNTASRMESSGLPMKIHISASTYEHLKENYPTFRVEERGLIELKVNKIA
ncbi:Serine-threonine/tyrosine-protein kinase catalytic domain [Trinorchestia longiramus]|nr:Serine-threonine/tyrosine-protein kinase catalytic domain [Trinorchestia longiramus]